MSDLRHTGMAVACGLVLTVLASGSLAAPVIPNGPIDRDIIFTVEYGSLGFDRDIGALGALVPLPGVAGAGEIEPTDHYGVGYTFDFQIESALLDDKSDEYEVGRTVGLFAAGPFTLTDRENGDVVLLTGAIDDDFVLDEYFAFGGGLWAANLPISISGGTLADEFGPVGTIAFNLTVTAPFPVDDFSQDIYMAGSITLSVPEPTSCLLLGLGALAILRRR